MNTADYLLEIGSDDDPALIDGTGVHTYRQLRDAATRISAALQDRDLERGARVGLLGANSLQWVAGYLAIMKLDLVAVPFPSTWRPAAVADAAEWVHCEAMIADGVGSRQLTVEWQERLLAVPNTEDSPPGVWPVSETDIDLDAALMFTSGTTTRPRAVRVTHRNLQSNTGSILAYMGLRQDDRMMVILPFSYCYGASLLHTHLRAGGAVVLCNSFVFPEVAVSMMGEQGCTGFAGVPSSYQLLLQASTFRTRDLPSLRRMLQAGGKMHNATIEEIVQAKPDASVYVMYGQTEATARLSYLPPDRLSTKLGSIGRGIPGVTLAVLDPQGEPVAPGEIGEICAEGDNISPGYLDDPESTHETFRDGMLHTGDMARVDADGYIFIVGRKADFIKTWGYRVSSLEVEAAVMEWAEVAAAAAFGVPDKAAGEAVVLAVVPAAGVSLTASEVMAFCSAHLDRRLRPHSAHVLENLPLNAAGKVDKAALAAQLVPDAEESDNDNLRKESK